MEHGSGHEHMEVAINIKSSLPQRGEGAKVLAACEACRKQRKRCTGTLPCQSCVRRGIECVFETLRKRRGPAGAGETDADRSIRIIVAASAGPVGGLPYEDTRMRRYKTRGEEGEGGDEYDGSGSPRESMWDHDHHKRSRNEEGPPAGSNPIGLPPLPLLRHNSGSSMYGGGGGGGDMSGGNVWSAAHAHAWASEMGYGPVMQGRGMMSMPPLGHMMSGYGGEPMGPAGQFVMGPHGPMLIPLIVPSLTEPPIPRQGSFTRGSASSISGVLQGESVRDPGRVLPRLLSRDEQSFSSDAHGGLGPGPRLPPTPRATTMTSRASSGLDLGAGPYAVAKSDLLGMLAVLCSDESSAPAGHGGASSDPPSAGAAAPPAAASRGADDVMEVSEEGSEEYEGEDEFTPEGDEEVEAWTEAMGVDGVSHAAAPHPAMAAAAAQQPAPGGVVRIGYALLPAVVHPHQGPEGLWIGRPGRSSMDSLETDRSSHERSSQERSPKQGAEAAVEADAEWAQARACLPSQLSWLTADRLRHIGTFLRCRNMYAGALPILDPAVFLASLVRADPADLAETPGRKIDGPNLALRVIFLATLSSGAVAEGRAGLGRHLYGQAMESLLSNGAAALVPSPLLAPALLLLSSLCRCFSTDWSAVPGFTRALTRLAAASPLPREAAIIMTMRMVASAGGTPGPVHSHTDMRPIVAALVASPPNHAASRVALIIDACAGLLMEDTDRSHRMPLAVDDVESARLLAGQMGRLLDEVQETVALTPALEPYPLRVWTCGIRALLLLTTGEAEEGIDQFHAAVAHASANTNASFSGLLNLLIFRLTARTAALAGLLPPRPTYSSTSRDGLWTTEDEAAALAGDSAVLADADAPLTSIYCACDLSPSLWQRAREAILAGQSFLRTSSRLNGLGVLVFAQGNRALRSLHQADQAGSGGAGSVLDSLTFAPHHPLADE